MLAPSCGPAKRWDDGSVFRQVVFESAHLCREFVPSSEDQKPFQASPLAGYFGQAKGLHHKLGLYVPRMLNPEPS